MDDPPDSSSSLSCCSATTKSTRHPETTTTTTTTTTSAWLTRSHGCVALLCLVLGNLSAAYVNLTPSSVFVVKSGLSRDDTNSSQPGRKHDIKYLRSSSPSLSELYNNNNNNKSDDIFTDPIHHTSLPTVLPEENDFRRFLEDTTNNENKCPDSGGSSSNPFSSVPFAIQIVMIVILIGFSALFSGLTLGLMGLDKTGLEIVMEGDDEDNAAAAKVIYPVRSNGNLLLCTLLLGNVAVNALLSILLADKAGGIVGFLASTFIIVIFGEIVPQALCQRYSLQIGSRAVPLVKAIMFILYPITYPISYVLNKALGHELATTYSNSEMSKLLEIHVKEGRFDKDTGAAMEGALKYKEIPVRDVMTPLENTFMLNVDEKLNFETVATIFKTGYSRIPVYECTVNNIIGLLFVKDLIFIDPEDETPVRNFVQIFGRGAHVVWPDDQLGDVLKELKQGRSHMALVRDVNNDNEEGKDSFYEIKGIITLEDIIEEILGDEIVDETDAFVDGTHSEKVNRMEGFDWGRLRLLDAKIVDATLTYDECKAVMAHLRTNYASAVSLLTDKQLLRFISETPVEELPTAQREIGDSIPEDVMYEKDVPTNVCTLILSGKVTVVAGQEGFRSDVSSWSVLAAHALTESKYSPDFTAFVSSGPCRCLRLSHELFARAVDASVAEKQQQGHQQSLPPSALTSVNKVKPTLNSSSFDSSNHDSGGAMTTAGTTNTTIAAPQPNTAERRDMIQSRRNKLIATLQSKSSKKSSASLADISSHGCGKQSPQGSKKKLDANQNSLELTEQTRASTSSSAGGGNGASLERRKRSASIEYMESNTVLMGKTNTSSSVDNNGTSNTSETSPRNINEGDV